MYRSFFYYTTSFFFISSYKKKEEEKQNLILFYTEKRIEYKEKVVRNLYMTLNLNRIFEQKDSIEQHQLHHFLKVKKKNQSLS